MTTSARNSAQPVVKLLNKTSCKIAETEANIEMFSKMAKNAVATNDVRSFVTKQSDKMRVTKGLNKKVIKSVMKQKLSDACSHVNQLKQQRCKLRKKLMSDGSIEKSEARRMIKKCNEEVAVCKNKQRVKNNRKYERNRWKQESLILGDNVPEGVKQYIDGMKIFESDVEPEKPIGPMICNKEIVLDKDEMQLLMRGPRFMKRNEIDINEFTVEVEKMIVKQGYNEDGSREESEESVVYDEEETKRINKAVREIETEQKMVYNKGTGQFDLGNSKASEYKFNKFVHMPRVESVRSEAMNEVRRKEMIKACEEVIREEKERITKKEERKKSRVSGGKVKNKCVNVRQENERQEKKNKNINSNLTESEQAGLKKLKQRVKLGEIVITVNRNR